MMVSKEIEPCPERSLSNAREAYSNRDSEGSIRAHVTMREHVEKHSKIGGYIKSIVFGGVDGIITTFAVVAGAVGGDLGVDVILILGLSSVFADAVSMGVGDALSTHSENEYILMEKERETWELENYRQGEIDEMIDLYVSKGMSTEDAKECIHLLAKYPELFVDVMMKEELGLCVPDVDDNPLNDGAVTFCSFVVFGMIPLLGYVCFYTANFTKHTLFTIACCVTGCALFSLGVVKATLTNNAWYKSGAEVLVLGGGVAAIAYVIGALVKSTVHS